MAATCIGLSGLFFGLDAESGVLVQNFTSTDTAQTTEIPKHDGTMGAVAFSDRRINVTLSGNSSTAPSTAVGAQLTLSTNASAISSGNYFITDISSTQSADGFQEFSLSASLFPGLSAT